ncbi:MAG: hypothetical protein KAQ95_07380, partial [Candidatus Heimdallarchaeota archaeon]|nr:hypothetical protein [Candidatus Heimdallarchaeota archaeon]
QLLIIQQLYTVGWNFLFLEKFDLAEHHFRKGFALAEKIGNKQEIAYGHHSLASIAQKNRDFSEAKDLWSKAIEMNKELGTERDLPFIYNELGYLYRNRLELDLALESFFKIIDLTGEDTAGIHIILGNLGYLFYVKGIYDEAEKYYLSALKKCEEIGDKKRYLPIILRNLIRLTTDKKDLKTAKKFLNALEQLQLETDEKRIKRAYQFASAYVLKASTRLPDWNKAVNFLEEILNDVEVTPYEEVSALIDISSILLRELHYTGKQEVFNDIKIKVERLVKIAEDRKYHMLLAQAYWLQSQLSLAEYDIDKARDYLFKAKTIAEFKKIEKLRVDIQKDQDKLENNMHVWEDLIKQKKPLVESLRMLSLENGVEKIAKEAVIEVLDEETGKTIEYRKLFAIKI